MVRGKDGKGGLKLISILLLLLGFCCCSEPIPVSNKVSIQETIPAPCDAPNVSRYETVTSPLYDSLELKISITEEDWWEYLDLNWTHGDSIVWRHCFDSLGLYIISAKFISIPGTNHPGIEVYNSTHIGNGQYNLYEVVGREIRNVATYRGVDHNWESSGITMDTSKVFKTGILNSSYSAAQNGKRGNIILSGIQETYCDTVIIDSVHINIELKWDDQLSRYE